MTRSAKSTRRDDEELASAAGSIQFGARTEVKGDAFMGSKQTIDTSGGAYIAGSVTTGGGDFVGRDKITIGTRSPDKAGVSGLFDELLATVLARSNMNPADRNDLLGELQGLQQEALKGAQADPESLMRQLRNVGRIAPDLRQRVAAMLADPNAGFSPEISGQAQKLLASQ
jgi:hypothetical protein